MPALLLSLASTTSAQVIIPEPKVIRGPQVSFLVVNDTCLSQDKGVSHVRGYGHLPIRMIVRDARGISRRQLQVFIAIYERDLAFPARYKPGRLVRTFADDAVMIAVGPGPLIRPYRREFKLPPE